MTQETPSRDGVDVELSEAVVAYYSAETSSFPWPNPDGVRALASTRTPEDLLAQVKALEQEIFAIPVDWSTMSLRDAGRHTQAVMTERHPELTEAATSALRWNFTYASR